MAVGANRRTGFNLKVPAPLGLSARTMTMAKVWGRIWLICRTWTATRPEKTGRGAHSGRTSARAGWPVIAVPLLGILALALGGCATQRAPEGAAKVEPPPQTLSPGDVIRIAFPSAQNLDTTQQIRRDGKVNLYLVGEVNADGLTPAELEKHLIKLYSTQLLSSEITVTVVSSSFAVYVTGAVLRPGKIQPDRALTVLGAIMEAGGFDHAKANTKSVVVIRTENGQTSRVTLNLKALMDGKDSKESLEAATFYLKAHDIVYVPEKFNWF